MRYLGLLLAKLAAAAGLLGALWRILEALLPEPDWFLRYRVARFPQDLAWTTALLVYWLLALALLGLIVADQRRRCRVCARRLRMPVAEGLFSYVSLFSPPRTESICPYGHGTLREPLVHLAASEPARWRAHGDVWTELGRGGGERR